MAITRIFGGTTIYVPGAYDTKNIILTGALPSIAVGKVAIIGEANKGRPGSVEILQFSPAALKDLINEYGSGPIVDSARLLATPSNDGRIVNGASAIYVYKTNNSTKANLALVGAGTFGSLLSLEYGEEANLISSQIEANAAVMPADMVGSAVDVTGTLAPTAGFSVREEGGAINTFVLGAGVNTGALLISALQNSANWSLAAVPAHLTFSKTGADTAVVVTVAITAKTNYNQNGASQVVEFIAGATDLLAILGLASHIGSIKSPQLEPSVRVILNRKSDGIEEDSDNLTGDVGGSVYMEVGYQGTTATLTINSSSLQTTVAGGSGSALNLQLSAFRTIEDLAEYIDSQTGYTCSVPAGVNGGYSPIILDRVSSLGICSSVAGLKPGKIKADAFTFYDYLRKNSTLVEFVANSALGLPDAMSKTFLAGGTKGASANSNFIDALTQFELIEDIDLIVPLVSQDYSDDLVENAGYTSTASTYTVDAIHLAVKTHCKKMSSTKSRKERACYIGKRGTLAECQLASLSQNSEFASMLFQDVSVLGTDGNLFWGQPHLAASIAAGMQAGADIGQPTTKKAINAVAVRHVKKQGLTPSASELYTDAKVDQAIEKGLMPLKAPSSGGVIIVVQNATYSKDSNFVYNRPSVFSAMNFIAKTIRLSLESKFVGTKVRTTTKDAIETEVIALMADFLRSEVIVGDDSNGGKGYKNLVINVEGNAVLIDVTVTPVQGIDFVLTNINVDNIRIS